MTKSTLAVIVTFLLVACASTNVSRDYLLSDTNNEGLAVVSFSSEGLAEGENPVWSYQRIDGTKKGEIITGYRREPLDWRSPPGRLAYIALAPGRYEFTRAGFPRQTAPATPYWTIGKNGIATANNPNDAGLGVTQYRSHDAGAFLVSFDIVAGRATYVGNLHFIWDEATQSGQVVVRNEAQHDLQLLRERLPQFRTDQIRVAVTASP